ncbi:MAG: hypothetical protein M3O50_15640, partial [Myxococcota bacterium]|nr:hypothetical protein [Myxococcota bacterium]
MKAIRFGTVWAARSAALAITAVAMFNCNNVGDCPAASAITPGGSCSGDFLQCPYTLESLSP